MARKTHEQFVEEVYKLVANEYTILSNYKGSKIKILIKHNKCDNEYEVKPNDFLNGRRCPKCRKFKRRKSNDEFLDELNNLVGNEYTAMTEYVKAQEYVKMRHNVCGETWNVKPYHFLNNNSRCPRCAKMQSKGSRRIEQWLIRNNYNYETEYKFKDCKHIKVLPFDFAIIKDDKPVIIIEFDGQQHFEAVGGWSNEENLKLTKLRDDIKNRYCKDNGIKLIRISYLEEEKIEKLLHDNLKVGVK